jgi:hypothetical protein
MELRHLRCFVAVAEELNVRQAAARLQSGQKHLYPFAVLRELPAERRWNLLQRAQLWPVPLAERRSSSSLMIAGEGGAGNAVPERNWHSLMENVVVDR